jgi:cbb3-type cytochrome oxidase maturation protein
LAIALVAVFVIAYVWSSRSGQFDDLTTPAMRALHDEPNAGVSKPAPRTTNGGSAS